MNKLRTFVFASSAASMILAGTLVACSSDDDPIISNDAGGPDGSKPDVADRPDASDEDVVDSGKPDVVTDSGLKVETYADQVANTLCNALTRCCFGNSNVADGGIVDAAAYEADAASTFNRNECIGLYETLGFESSNVGLETTKSNVVVNQAKGADCVAKINTLACNLDGASLKTIRAACFGALEGQLANGAPCKATLECNSGAFCLGAGTSDAGTPLTGTCAPLRTQGQSCDIQNTGTDSTDSNAAEVACSHRGGGSNNLRCASYDPTTGAYKTDRAGWTCEPAVANGEICNTTVSCLNGICDPGDNFDKYTCEPVLTYFNKFACTNHLD